MRTAKRVGLFFISAGLMFAFASSARAQSANLFVNGSFESASGSAPTGWVKEFWGSPVPTFVYPAVGNAGSKGVSITLNSNSSGDANWQPSVPVSVTAGATYTYSTWYKSNTATEIDAEYTSSNGSQSYVWVADVPSSGGVWKQYTASFKIPSGITKALVYHLIFNKGTLTIDDVSLVSGTGTVPAPAPPPPPPPPSPTPSPTPPAPPPAPGAPTLTFAANPTTISSGQSANLSWASTNATSCSASGSWTGGKILSGSQLVFPKASATYVLTCTGSGGSVSKSVSVSVGGTAPPPPPSPTPPPPPPTPTPPPPPPSPNQFSEGMVTLSFDDAWASQYTNALPILQASGLPATFYFISEVIQNNSNFPGFMSPSMATTIANAGYEIADHTITHPDLTTLAQSQVINEITASRAYLQNLTGKSITTLAYPYGATNSTIENLIKNNGYVAARGVDDSELNTPSSDTYNLFGQCVENTESVSTIESWINKAKTNKQWYIICLHEIGTTLGGQQYSMPTSELQSIVNYIKSSGIKVVTVAQGRARMGN